MEDLMKEAVTTVVGVLGSLLGIAQTGYWCEWFCIACGEYWARRGAPRARGEGANWGTDHSRSQGRGESRDE
jgi:hypothetical protein